MRHGLLHKMVGQTVQKGTGAGGAGGCFEGGAGGVCAAARDGGYDTFGETENFPKEVWIPVAGAGSDDLPGGAETGGLQLYGGCCLK
jgi:hypothetical protein